MNNKPDKWTYRALAYTKHENRGQNLLPETIDRMAELRAADLRDAARERYVRAHKQQEQHRRPAP